MNGPSAIREQRERASVLKNEKKLREGEPATLFARARAGLDDTDVPGGRYAAQQAHFAGEGSYPAAAEWTRDGVGLEPPTGIDINAQEPCGTFVEVQRSEFANSENPASPFNRQMDGEANGVGDPAPAGATPAARAEPADRLASSPRLDRGSAIPSAARLAELLSSGLIRRPQMKRRRL